MENTFYAEMKRNSYKKDSRQPVSRVLSFLS